MIGREWKRAGGDRQSPEPTAVIVSNGCFRPFCVIPSTPKLPLRLQEADRPCVARGHRASQDAGSVGSNHLG